MKSKSLKMSNPISMYVPTKFFHGEPLLFLSELCFYFTSACNWSPITECHFTGGKICVFFSIYDGQQEFIYKKKKKRVLLINKQKLVPQVSPSLPMAKVILVSCLNLPATPLMSKLSASFDNLHYQKH